MDNQTKCLRSNEATETISLSIEVTRSQSGGSARVVFLDRDRSASGEMRYAVELGAEIVDELIEALVPVLESRNANWEHTWARTPNPQHRPGE